MNHYYGAHSYQQRVVEAMQWRPEDTPAANVLASWLQRSDAVWSTVGIGQACVIRLYPEPGGTDVERVGFAPSGLPLSVLGGDWIVKSPTGNFHVMDAVEFAATYEKVESDR